MLTKRGLCIAISLHRVQYVKVGEKKNCMVEKADQCYLTQVIKVNISSDKPVDSMYP